ncbi:hypothetical protein D3C80_584290 [compost metagenome]
MPLFGTARSCSLIVLIDSPRSATGVSCTGYRVLNQPRVRVRSMPSNSSSRPWPSSSIRLLACPLQRVMTRASAVNSKSLI